MIKRIKKILGGASIIKSSIKDPVGCVLMLVFTLIASGVIYGVIWLFLAFGAIITAK